MPHYAWANREPGAMRVWLPLADRADRRRPGTDRPRARGLPGPRALGRLPSGVHGSAPVYRTARRFRPLDSRSP
ncbi:hypothetical protein AB0O07_06640 [Streptomyces sp. NPDC093085]|uniref:hypothetical protein n=1 Tax=Streptomyces sp. NPDC093085 TaxID=3155068 RepID=UPI00341C7B1B